jgi:hypothetical protein
MTIYLFILVLCFPVITPLTNRFHFVPYCSWTVKSISRPYLVNGQIPLNVTGLPVKRPLILYDFNQTLVKIAQYTISRKSAYLKPSPSKRTDIQPERN